MHNVLARCSSHLTFVHNGAANVLLPLVTVDVEVHTGQTDESLNTFSFTSTPAGIQSIIQTLSEVMASIDQTVKQAPPIVSEEEWIQRVQARVQAAAQAPIGVDPGTVLDEAAGQVQLTEKEVMDALLAARQGDEPLENVIQFAPETKP